jgi:hypothetical protein
MGKSTPFSIDFAYGNGRPMPKPSNQSDKFKQAARELEADQDEARWGERLRKIAKAKPGGAAKAPPDQD